MPRSGRRRPRGLTVLVALCLALVSPTPAAQAVTTEFASGITAGARPSGIALGQDGNLWFTEFGSDRIGRITSAGVVTEFVLAAGRGPLAIVSGPDGRLWFTERLADRIGRIDPLAGTPAAIQASLVEFAVPGAGSAPTGIAAGPDGALWFTQFGSDEIGRLTTAGIITQEFALATGSGPAGITAGPDGALWFTQPGTKQIGRLTTVGGILTEFPLPAVLDPEGITAGPDGALWFTDFGSDQIGRITTSGAVTVISLALGRGPLGITTGPDGTLWFTAPAGTTVGRISPAGGVFEFPVPTAAGQPAGIVAGPDEALWFAEVAAGKIGRIAAADVGAFSLTVARAGAGLVTASPGTLACGGVCALSAPNGSDLLLAATPAPGFVFAGWSGAGCSGTAGCPITLSSDTAVTATFTLVTAPSIALVPNATTFGTGQVLTLTLGFANLGPAGVGDVYLGVLLPPASGPGLGCPGGDAVVFFANAFTRVVPTCLSAAPSTFAPLVSNASVPAGFGPIVLPGFFQLTWPPIAPSGRYTFFVVLVAASALNGASASGADVAAAATATVNLGP